MSKNKNIDWQTLITQAQLGFDLAYAPYSNFQVGAAAFTAQGNVVKGCNVENASYGLTVCAERNCIAQGVINSEHAFTAMVVFTKQEKLTPPCGACRQVIAEFFAPDALVMAVNHVGDQKTWTVDELLPNAFTPQHLSSQQS